MHTSAKGRRRQVLEQPAVLLRGKKRYADSVEALDSRRLQDRIRPLIEDRGGLVLEPLPRNT